MAGKDYYHLLGVAKNASDEEIKRAYRKLAMKYHPTKIRIKRRLKSVLKEINEAYAVLSDKEKRKQYDMFGSEGFQSRFSQEDIFRDFDLEVYLKNLARFFVKYLLNKPLYFYHAFQPNYIKFLVLLSYMN
jgi:curved DNA-binding protein